MKLLGMDNVMLEVGDLDEAVEHYSRLGFTPRFRLADPPIALFGIGDERPGLLVRVSTEPQRGRGRFWVEVTDAHVARNALLGAGVQAVGEVFPTATGRTVEVTDQWHNVVGFADYAFRPEAARSS